MIHIYIIEDPKRSNCYCVNAATLGAIFNGLHSTKHHFDVKSTSLWDSRLKQMR